MPRIITKMSGEKEPFNPQKFRESLRRAGAAKPVIDKITKKIEENKSLETTKEIYRHAFNELRKIYKPMAARYNLKTALMKLGPSGYPFERFIGQLFKEKGYSTKIGVEVIGQCINHEMDVVANKDKEVLMIETKFHNRHGNKTDIQDTLYMKARFDDILTYYKKVSPKQKFECLLVTNTQFTRQAIQYAECSRLSLLGWGYPKNNGLETELEKYRLIPITALTSLTTKVKTQLIKQGCILCRDVAKNRKMLERILRNPNKVQRVIDEAIGVCEI